MKIKKTKPKIGIFSLTSCAGCQFNILFIGDELLGLFNSTDIIHFPMAKEDNDEGPYDIALVEGCVTMKKEIAKVKEIRKKSKYLIALGTCATYGGIPSIKNFLDLEDVEEEVYESQDIVKSLKVVGIGKHVKVDYFLRGCPFDKKEFMKVIKDLMIGKKPKEVQQPVCIECRQNENVCLLQEGKTCMGPLTHGGCNSVCVNVDIPCTGCRGPLPDSNVAAEYELLKKHGIKKEDIILAFRKFAGTSKIYAKYVGGKCEE